MAHKFFRVSAGMLVLAALTQAAAAAPRESPPTLLTQWRTEGDRLPTDFCAVPPSRIYLVDQSWVGTFWSIQNSGLLGGFSTVNPITNDAGDLYDVTVAPDGRIYAVDLPPSGFPGRLWRFASNGSRIGSAPLGATAPIIGNALAMLDSETLLLALATRSGGGFLRLNLDGTVLGAWGPSLPAGWAESGMDIAVSGTGDVFVLDAFGHRILKFDSAGNQLLAWGQRGTGEGEFDLPGGIAVDEFGNVYVADYGNNRVQKFSRDGQFLVQWGGTCNMGPCAPLSLVEPRSIACLPGNLVIVGTRSLTVENAPITVVKVFQASAPTPVKGATWGQVKALYRGTRTTTVTPGTENR